MAEVDSYLMSVYNSTKGVTSASFAPFFSEAAAQSSMFKTATKAMGEGIQSGWDDMVRITFSGTAAQIASKFEEFDKAIDQLQPVGGYVDQFNAEMEKYITAVENANKYQDELDHFTLPNAPTKPGEGSSDETWEKYYNDLSNYHSKIEYGKDTLRKQILVEEKSAEAYKMNCEGIINQINGALGSPLLTPAPVDLHGYDSVDYDFYRDDETGEFHYYTNYYKDGQLVRRDYEEVDGWSSRKGTRYFYEGTTDHWGNPTEVVKEDHVEYSSGYQLPGFRGRDDTVIENGVFKYNRNGEITSGTAEKYSYTKAPNGYSDYWWETPTDKYEYDNYSYEMDPTSKMPDDYYDYEDNKYVITKESYDKRVCSSDGVLESEEGGYSVTRTSDNRRLTEHRDYKKYYYSPDEDNPDAPLESYDYERNYNFASYPDGSTRATWDLCDGKEGYYSERDSEGYSTKWGYARCETQYGVTENFQEVNDRENNTTTIMIGSNTSTEVNNRSRENGVTLVYKNNDAVSRTIESVDLYDRDGNVEKTLVGVTETYSDDKWRSAGYSLMTERTIDQVHYSDGTTENGVHDYMRQSACNTSVIESSTVDSITGPDGTVIGTDVTRSYDNSSFYHEGDGTYGYENNGEPAGYVYCYGSSHSSDLPGVYYDNSRNFHWDDWGNYLE